jgi:hypothetical protein
MSIHDYFSRPISDHPHEGGPDLTNNTHTHTYTNPNVNRRRVHKHYFVNGELHEYSSDEDDSNTNNTQAPVVSPLFKNTITYAKNGEFNALITNLGSALQTDNWFDKDENGNTILIVLASKLSSQLPSPSRNLLMTCVNMILYDREYKAIPDNVNIKNNEGDSAIILAGKGAPENNDITKKFIDAIVEKGAYINDSNNGTTAFTNAAIDDHNLVIAHYILLKEAIHWANKRNEKDSQIPEQTSKIKEILEVLPSYKWFDQDGRGETILIRLADKGNLELVKHILEKANNKTGAIEEQVNLKNNNGNSAIILTGRTNQNYNYATKLIIEALIKKGAKITDKNNPVKNKHNGQNALDLVIPGNTELETFIKSKILDNTSNKGGKRTAKKSSKSRKMRKRKARKTRRVR